MELFGRRDRAWRDNWFRKFRQKARVVVVFYDRRDDCYYDRYYPGLHEIRAYESDGRYYRDDDDRYDDRYDDRDRRDGWDH